MKYIYIYIWSLTGITMALPPHPPRDMKHWPSIPVGITKDRHSVQPNWKEHLNSMKTVIIHKHRQEISCVSKLFIQTSHMLIGLHAKQKKSLKFLESRAKIFASVWLIAYFMIVNVMQLKISHTHTLQGSLWFSHFQKCMIKRNNIYTDVNFHTQRHHQQQQ